MEGVPYDRSRCLTCWFRVVQSPYLKWPLSAGVRVERLDPPPRRDRGTSTFPREIRWPARPVPGEAHVFEIEAAIPVPIVSHDQVLFVTLRDVLDRIVARVHVTYDDARTLRRGGFCEWYAAEPAPLATPTTIPPSPLPETAFDELAKYERTTFRLVHYSHDGDLYARPPFTDPMSDVLLHPTTRMLTSNDIECECFRWATDVVGDEDDPSPLLLAGGFRLPVQTILFDTDENPTEMVMHAKREVKNGLYLAGILLDPTRVTEYDRLFLACEYASGNMCALDVPSLADDDDYTRLAFPDGSGAVHRTATDKTGARLAILRRLNRAEWHPAIVMTTVASGRRFLEAGLVLTTGSCSDDDDSLKVVILSERRSTAILLVAWRIRDIFYTRWRSHWRRLEVSMYSEVWTLEPSSTSTPHTYRCENTKWTQLFLPALLATTSRRVSPFLCPEAINRIARAVTNRRARGIQTGGYMPLGYDDSMIFRAPSSHATAIAIQRGVINDIIPGLAAARQARNDPWRYAAFW